jgi:potassium-dependent mechanosensitive channel
VDALPEWIDPNRLLTTAFAARKRFMVDVLTLGTLGQIAAILLALVVARLLAPGLRATLDARVIARVREPRLKQAGYAVLGVVSPVIWLTLLWLAMLLSAQAGLASALIRVAMNLVAAWVVIRLVSSLVRDPAWSRVIAIVAWSLAALNILGVLDAALGLLDSVAISVGKIRISLLAVTKAALLLAALSWAANWLSEFMDRRAESLSRLTPSLRLLFSKLFKIVLFGLAVLVALSSIGIDITALAVFTGAVGVGVGFGLQAVISNFVAGIILLLERSLKIGDFIELSSGARGEVREINIRNTVVTTNDNIDIIVPNSEFVNGTVTNWTFRDAHRRLRIPFGVAYGTDKELVRKAGLEAAASVEHTLTGQPRWEPQVWLVGFGDNSLNFELVVWLTPTAVKRPAAVNAAYCWTLETTLRRHGIEIPFPQRDLHIHTGAPLRIDGAGRSGRSVQGKARHTSRTVAPGR